MPGVIGLAVLFAVLTGYVWANPANAFDVAAIRAIQAQAWLEPLAFTNGIVKASAFRVVYVLIAAACIIGRRYLLSLAVAGALASELVSSAIKLIVARPRPSVDVAVLRDISTGYSYVSGHTLEYTLLFVLLGFFVLTLRVIGALRYVLAGALFALPLVVGLGRVYAGAHWLTDVLGSFLLGAAVLLIVLGTCDNLLKPRRRFT